MPGPAGVARGRGIAVYVKAEHMTPPRTTRRLYALRGPNSIVRLLSFKSFVIAALARIDRITDYPLDTCVNYNKSKSP